MKDCAKELRKYHDEEVTLPKSEQTEMRKRRDANRDRLKRGLERDGKPKAKEHIVQGSYAMKTMVQHPDNDYDIDDGALFWKEELKGSRDGEMSPQAAKQMVANALKDGAFAQDPVVKTNCVRIVYKAGYHVDIPIYRQLKDQDDTVYELASTEWKRTNPEGVTEWFKGCVAARKFFTDGDDQLRRVVRYLKTFARSRPSWNMPSGFILTVLANEKLVFNNLREDEMLRYTMRDIHQRLTYNRAVYHPVLTGETLTKTTDDADMRELRDRLEWALEELKALDDEQTCTRNKALKTWGRVFNTDFFDQFLDDNKNGGSKGAGPFVIGASKNPNPVDKQGDGRYA